MLAACAAAAYADGRAGDVSFALRTPQALVCHRCDTVVHTASVVKAMLLVAYLRRERVATRPLARDQRAVLSTMVRRSGNRAATAVFAKVGTGGLARLARRAGMTRTVPSTPVWGATRTTARDQTRLMLRVEALLPPRHRAYALRLLATIVPSQRWGVARVAPPCWELHFKGGWGDGDGDVDHQVALLRRGGDRVALAVMTTGNPHKRYGDATLEGVAQRLLRDLRC